MKAPTERFSDHVENYVKYRPSYPPKVYQKALALEGAGAEPVRIELTIPTITVPGEPFAVKVALVDAKGLATVRYDGSVRIQGVDGDEAEIRFSEGRPAVGLISGMKISTAGLYRVSGELDGKTFYSNPTSCQADPGYRIYWGDPHVHTHLSDCHPDHCRSAHFGYIAGRWQSGLDFVGMADHVSWGVRITRGKWRTQVVTSELHDDAPHFVTLPGYEVSLRGGKGGDNNVYARSWPETWVDEWETGSALTLAQKVEEMVGRGNYIVVPHHTSRGGGKDPKHGEIPDENFPGEEAMPVVEIHSRWGTSEYKGNPNALKVPYDGKCYAIDFLNQGIRFGFIAGTDTHSTIPCGDGAIENLRAEPGFTAVRCRALTRDQVFDGIRRRNCYATSKERIFLEATVAGASGGQIIQAVDGLAVREIKVRAAGKSDIEKVEIVRNGDVIHTERPADWKTELSYTDSADLKDHTLSSLHYVAFAYYYVRVTTCSNGQAWSSPVWLDLLPVENEP